MPDPVALAVAGGSLPVLALWPHDTAAVAKLRLSLASAATPVRDVRAASGTERRADRRRGGEAAVEIPIVTLSAHLPDGRWLNGVMPTPRPEPFLTARLGAATLALYLIVLGVTVLIAVRLARPLRDLARAAEQFGGRGTPVEVAPRGPEDLRRALEAFNAMNRRVVALLDEKDRMLGAIGHDLRTTLASLRIRAEAVESDAERARMVATIEEMNAMLEDILVLARSGRAREAARAVDVAALVDALAEDYRDRGQAVEVLTAEHQPLEVQPTLLRRAIRNLVDNGLNYGGSAELSVRREGEAVLIAVRDRGPGLTAEEAEQVLQPFARLEQSRNRETGGTGLGLAIAKAVAESHGGTLILANAPDGGLIATIALPAGG